ncbi:MAG TPA: YncE family protein [Ktedonobacterales bacterium]
MNAISRISGYRCCVRCTLLVSACMLLVLVGWLPPTTFADGGAPQLAYVAGAGQGISIIDIAQQRITRSLAVGGEPRTVLLSQDGSALYVTQPTLGRVAVIDAKTGKTRCTANLPGQPLLLALRLDGAILYVAGQGDTSVRALNPAKCTVERTFETHQPIYGLAVAASTAADATPDTPNQIWIAGTTSLTVFDATGNLLGTVAIVDGPQHITIPGGFTAYVTTRQGTVVAVDLNTRTVFRTLLSGSQFGSMDYDAPTGEVYVPDELHNQLDVLIPVTADSPQTPQEPVRIIALSGSPQSVAITNDGALGFVALSNGQVLMLDVPGRKVVSSFAVGGTPRFVITGSYPPIDNPPSSSQQTVIHTPSISNLLLILSVALAGCLLLSVVWLSWRYYLKRPAGHDAAQKHL